MPAVPGWAVPAVFDLTNPYSGNLAFNEQGADGIYLLIQDGCTFDIGVRSTTDNMPQADGSILHHRFLTGVTMQLTVQLWQSVNDIACTDEQRVVMLDTLSGSVRSLLNAGDNQGRLAWTIEGGADRMLDDVRLLVYPVFTAGPPPTVVFTIDSEFPYAQDLDQTCTLITDGSTVSLDNTGSADYSPVFLVNVTDCARTPDGAAVNDFTITVVNLYGTTQFIYTSAFPGAQPISAGGHYAEINCFRNTIYEDGNGADLKAGVDELNSEYPVLSVGNNDVTIDGCDMIVLWAPAWG